MWTKILASFKETMVHQKLPPAPTRQANFLTHLFPLFLYVLATTNFSLQDSAMQTLLSQVDPAWCNPQSINDVCIQPDLCVSHLPHCRTLHIEYASIITHPLSFCTNKYLPLPTPHSLFPYITSLAVPERFQVSLPNCSRGPV